MRARDKCYDFMQAIINTGSMYPAGSQSFTLENPTYTRAVSTNGWTSTGASNGIISGVVQLVRHLSADSRVWCPAYVCLIQWHISGDG